MIWHQTSFWNKWKLNPFPGADMMLQLHCICWCLLYCKLSLLTGRTVCEEKAVNISYKLFFFFCCVLQMKFFYRGGFLFCACPYSDFLWICIGHTHTAVTLPVIKSCSHFILAMENILGWRVVVMDSGDEQQPISFVTWDTAPNRLTPYYSKETNTHVGYIWDLEIDRLLQESFI